MPRLPAVVECESAADSTSTVVASAICSDYTSHMEEADRLQQKTHWYACSVRPPF